MRSTTVITAIPSTNEPAFPVRWEELFASSSTSLVRYCKDQAYQVWELNTSTHGKTMWVNRTLRGWVQLVRIVKRLGELGWSLLLILSTKSTYRCDQKERSVCRRPHSILLFEARCEQSEHLAFIYLSNNRRYGRMGDIRAQKWVCIHFWKRQIPNEIQGRVLKYN